jgi:drug/metabolite transporter (DMT)-like permease
MKNYKFLAQLGMVLTTMIWGVTFVMVKDALNDATPFMFAALRFGLSFVLACIYVNKGIRDVSFNGLVGGLVCGFCLYVGYAFQNYGLIETTPSKSAFITSVSVILVPVILVAFRIKSVHLRIWVATFLAIVGLYILLNPAGGEFNIGDILTFGCAVSFAVHVIFQDYYLSKGVHVSHLLLTQLMFITVFSCLSVCVFEDLSLIMSDRLINAILVTGVLATFIALFIMVWAQTILSPGQTAILLSLEPVFAALFSTIFAGEILGLHGWIGGSVIVFAVLSLELFPVKK